MLPQKGAFPGNWIGFVSTWKIHQSDQVLGVITSGTASLRFTLDQRNSPARLSFHSPVTGLYPNFGKVLGIFPPPGRHSLFHQRHNTLAAVHFDHLPGTDAAG